MEVITERTDSLSLSLLSRYFESHSSTQMIKVYKINVNSNFNHAKVLRYTKTVPHTLQQNQIPVIFPLVSLMFR